MDKNKYWKGSIWVFLTQPSTVVLKATRVPAEDASGGILFQSDGRKNKIHIINIIAKY